MLVWICKILCAIAIPVLQNKKNPYLFTKGFDFVLWDWLVVIELVNLSFEDGDLVH